MSDKTTADEHERMAIIRCLLDTCRRIEQADDPETVALQSIVYRALLNKLDRLGTPGADNDREDGDGRCSNA